MQINPDLSTDNMALSLLQKRPDAAGVSNQASPATQSDSIASHTNALLPRLAESPSPVQYGNVEVQDSSEATQVMDSLVQRMSTQPGLALAAHANQVPGNILSLLQSTD